MSLREALVNVVSIENCEADKRLLRILLKSNLGNLVLFRVLEPESEEGHFE